MFVDITRHSLDSSADTVFYYIYHQNLTWLLFIPSDCYKDHHKKQSYSEQQTLPFISMLHSQ